MIEKKKIKSVVERRMTILLILFAASRAGVLIKRELFDTFFWLLECRDNLVASTYPFNLSNRVRSEELRKDLRELIGLNFIWANTRCFIDEPFSEWVKFKKGEFVRLETILAHISAEYISIRPLGRKRLVEWVDKKGYGSNFDRSVNELVVAIKEISALPDLFQTVQQVAHARNKVSVPALAKT